LEKLRDRRFGTTIAEESSTFAVKRFCRQGSVLGASRMHCDGIEGLNGGTEVGFSIRCFHERRLFGGYLGLIVWRSFVRSRQAKSSTGLACVF